MVNANETPSPAETAQSAPEATPPTANAAARQESINISNISDQAAEVDLLGFTPYVEAIAEFLTNDATEPPLTLSIEGDWGSGKSSFMRQLQKKLEQIEQQKGNSISRKVWFNAWRHDKVEALWAAFALEFLEQISQPQIEVRLFNPQTWLQIFNRKTWEEFIQIRIGKFKLFHLRFNWQENKVEALRIASLGLFFTLLAAALPLLFFSSGANGINLLSDRILCRLSPSGETEDESAPDSSSADMQAEPEPDNCLTGFTYILLWLGGFGGTTTGALALLVKAGEIMGDPKNDLKQYLESPDYESKVEFIEKFHKDFEKIVNAYVGEGKKVYVFIDDLDRCELTKAADLMQGLNLLISNDPNLIFILGMDREKVAAGIALKQKDVMPYLSSPAVVLNQSKQQNQIELKGLEYGYAFIEKFVQLPFQLPRPSQQNFEDFLVTLSSPSDTADKGEKNHPFSWFNKILQTLREKSKSPEATSTSQSSDRAQPGEQSSTETLFDSRETLKLELTRDSPRVQAIVLNVAPALDYNPRRIKQFINLFRLKVFIASNTGLFDELIELSRETESGTEQTNDSASGESNLETNGEATTGTVIAPLTLEQLGKFTALCMKYPLLQVDLADNPKLLQSLHRYATERDAWDNTAEAEDNQEESSIRKTTHYWGSYGPLVTLLQVGYDSQPDRTPSTHTPSDNDRPPHYDLHSYDLGNVDVNKLLQVSPPVQPIDRVELNSERGVDYRRLRALLRAKQWKAADQETRNVMSKAAQQEERGYLDIPSIEQFPCWDLQTIDQLWVTASDGRFGLSIQKEMYVECGGILDGEYHDKAWNELCKKNGWKEDGSYVRIKYDITSPKAHLPWCSRKKSDDWDEILFFRMQACKV